MKQVPFTVSVNAAPPTVVEAGLRPVVVGRGVLIEIFTGFRAVAVAFGKVCKGYRVTVGIGR